MKKILKDFIKRQVVHAKHTLLYIIGGAAIIIGIVWLVVWLNKDNHAELTTDRTIDITPAQIMAIREIGQWEFLAISDEEIVDTVNKGFFKDDELVRIYYGTLRLGIDLHKTKPQWIQPEGGALSVTLPPIELLDHQFIDEARTRSFYESGSWSNQAREALYRKAYDKMLARCMTQENIAIARENAIEQFTQLMRTMGFNHIRITFENGQPTAPDNKKK